MYALSTRRPRQFTVTPRFARRPGGETEARSPYGQTKAAMEQLCELYHYTHGLSVVGLATSRSSVRVNGPTWLFTAFVVRPRRHGVHGFRYGRADQGFHLRSRRRRRDAGRGGGPMDGQRVFNVGGGSPASFREVIDEIWATSRVAGPSSLRHFGVGRCARHGGRYAARARATRFRSTGNLDRRSSSSARWAMRTETPVA